MKGRQIYARIGCMKLTEGRYRCPDPRLCGSPSSQLKLLIAGIPEAQAHDITALIDSGEALHRLVHEGDAPPMGFLTTIQ